MKCQHCKKKTHLEFKCICGIVCCVKCRTPEIHGCHEKEKEKIILEKVVASKVDRI